MGISDPELAPKMPRVLDGLGARHALIVHGQDGLDEVSLAAPTDVWEVKEGAISSYTVTPDDFGLDGVDNDSLTVAGVAESASTLREVLAGSPGPARSVVLANAAAALIAADRATTLRKGVELAANAIDTGRANAALDSLITLSQDLE